MSTVNVLHCGGEEEIHFIEYLENIIATSKSSVFLDYTKFQSNQSKDLLTFHDAQRYRGAGIDTDKQTPLIVLISRQFFDLMWKTTYKNPLLNIITSSTMKKCLHVWLDLDEEDVRRYSNRLVSSHLNFRRIVASELTTQLPSSKIVNRIVSLLDESCCSTQFSTMNNYIVDDEQDEMRDNFIKAYFQKADQLPETLQSINGIIVKPKKQKSDVYKDVLRTVSMSPEGVEACTKDKSGAMTFATSTHSSNGNTSVEEVERRSIRISPTPPTGKANTTSILPRSDTPANDSGGCNATPKDISLLTNSTPSSSRKKKRKKKTVNYLSD